jgi:hypothetical protein
VKVSDPYFAQRYTRQQILEDASAAKSFENEFLAAEADFFEQCRDPRSGLAYDGLDLNRQTGRVSGIRNWSAPSKECLDLGLLLKALQGDAKAVSVVGRGDAQQAKAKAVSELSKKLQAYQEFQAQRPEYAGFLPWFSILSDKITPSPDWEGKIPGLDNGEWMWTMLAAEKVLRDQGHPELAAQYAHYNQGLIDNVTRVFYDPKGVACRGDVRILPNGGYEALHKGAFMTGEHGVHEGCMLIHFLTLFGKDLPAGATDKIWDDISMKRRDTRHGTSWEGFWASAHESWAYLFLPFRDQSEYADLFRIREKIRTQNAVQRAYPGLATSTTNPRGGYLSDAGIEGLNSQRITGNDTFAVYGAFPLALQFANHTGPGNIALAWLHNMLSAPRMQGPMGAGESGSNDGRHFSPVKTVDGTHPTLLGLMGGLEKEMADVMKERGVYSAFRQRIASEYSESFGNRPLREPKPFAAPEVEVPQQHLGPYTQL